MLLLPTGATIEAMNVSTDRRHPFHTYNDRNRFRQLFWIHTTKHRSRHRRRGERRGNLEWKWVIETLMPWLQSMLLSDFVILMAGWFHYTAAHANLLFLSYFSLPAIIQTSSSLAWEVVQKYVQGWTRMMKPLCLWFIKWLTSRTKCSSHRVIKKCCYFQNDAVGWRRFLLSHSVQSLSSIRRHLHCIVGKSVDFPDLKTKTRD